jgi:hypothetical protein
LEKADQQALDFMRQLRILGVPQWRDVRNFLIKKLSLQYQLPDTRIADLFDLSESSIRKLVEARDCGLLFSQTTLENCN